eukprot:CAMPEP_0206137788 /NCGR_PEP_ID=MMETSP1473-20131121/2849_1 /ASSEMBLY_ACC=CAM_ASM_001109 /TAXON_ID=1461547 /ORGANISM="Stichococcus sp, Strain RCC1054" /LENGTH=225 /DNA_ID=CAMNT_0053531027 /DNA_START=99 /DNA_END=776 /DNA_ORIENTATION=+
MHEAPVPVGQTGQTGALHEGGVAGPVRTDNKGEVGVTGRNRRVGDGVMLNTGARVGLALSQLLTACAFLIVLAALSSLQKRANELLLPEAQALIYRETFQSAGYQPYPNDAKNQFAFQWYILAAEIFVFFVIAVLLLLPRTLLRLKHVAMAFLVYVFVLTTIQIPSQLYFKRSPTSGALFGTRKVQTVLAGTIIGAIANALSIIFLGLLRDTHATDGHRRTTSNV